MGLKDKRIDAGAPLDARIAAAIASRLEGGRLDCAAAWAIADRLGVEPLTVGRTADGMQVRLSACQLGFFGHASHPDGVGETVTAVPEAFSTAVLAAAEHDQISCARLWGEADRFGVARPVAGELADRLGLKVRHCDLGAF